jgi:TonB family protein
LQCIKNCQPAKLKDLQDSDGGKDRLRIRVSIDANGIVTAAEIAKSSGNLQLDRTVLEGISQMQFQPSGKPIKGIIRANIFL